MNSYQSKIGVDDPHLNTKHEIFATYEKSAEKYKLFKFALDSLGENNHSYKEIQQSMNFFKNIMEVEKIKANMAWDEHN
ncbi:MAG: hypothetical protein JKX76_01965 [Colwellia sp.]|nr:hypothetical protein [Colwellia sp.]